MKAALALTSAFALAGCASLLPTPAAAPEALIADWNVDLQFDPASPPGSTTMAFSAASNGACAGSFYGTDMQSCRAIVRRDEVIFAAVTADQSGAYHHSGRLGADGIIRGQTLSIGRDFLMNWTAEKSP
jgi:hypothetical protein